MRNSLIYTLIGLMSLALAGITVIQILWISRAIEEQENEFQTRVNVALTDVNDKIYDKETATYIDRSFGDIDSLVNQLIVFRDSVGDFLEFDQSNSDVVIAIGEKKKPIHGEMTLTIQSDMESIAMGDDSSRIQFTRKLEIDDSLNWLGLKGVDSIRNFMDDQVMELHINATGDDADLLETTLKHRTFQRFFGSKDVTERIDKEELKEYIEGAFSNQGLENDFTFAVLDKVSGENEMLLTSPEFGGGKPEFVFKSELLPSDRGNSNYDLVLHLDNRSAFVWSEVKPMVWLSVLFTLLILFCFSYALYFIFKQKKISQIKDDFVNNMTHELKTPLATISLAADSIKHPEVIHDRQEVLHFVTMIKNEEDRMNSQIEKVLEIAALDKGSLQLNRSAIDLKTMVEECIGHIGLTLKNIGASWQFNTNLDAAPVFADRLHIQNVVSNLLDNSVKYRREENLQLEVDLEKQGNQFLLRITDNGIGMSKKSLTMAFDKFYREESGNIHNVKGFGLGLTYVKNIVDLHNGSISLSHAQTQGLVVEVLLNAHGK